MTLKKLEKWIEEMSAVFLSEKAMEGDLTSAEAKRKLCAILGIKSISDKKLERLAGEMNYLEKHFEDCVEGALTAWPRPGGNIARSGFRSFR